MDDKLQVVYCKVISLTMAAVVTISVIGRVTFGMFVYGCM